MAPEALGEEGDSHVGSSASDVYMLGGCFIEVLTACTRTPFDWLPAHDVVAFRTRETSRQVGCIQVRSLLLLSPQLGLLLRERR